MRRHLENLDLLADASGTDSNLLHLLSCPECRSQAIRRLLEETLPAEVAEMPDVDYDTVFEKLADLDPALLEEAQARRAGAERLMKELLALPEKQRFAALSKERFQNDDLLDLLLERSHACQLEAPRDAAGIARIAARLSGLLLKGDEQMAEALVRALCLEANAFRLAGHPRRAERLLARAAVYLDTAEERAFYCRTLALVLWEQARSDEAIALLERSARLYDMCGPPGEQGVCIALLGLLTAEENRPVEALSLLYRGWTLMDRDLRPILAARVGLSLALGLAEAGEIEQARIVQREVWPLMRSVGDKEEVCCLFGMEALLLASLGKRAESVDLVEGVLRTLLEMGSLGEALPAALDLALLRDGGKLDSVVTLLATLYPPVEPLRSVLATCISVLQRFDLPVESELTRESLVKVTRRNLRRILRTSGLPLKPVPFA